MEDGIEDESDIDLESVEEALASSSTKQRGASLATLRQQIEDSGTSSEIVLTTTADKLSGVSELLVKGRQTFIWNLSLL